MFFSRKTQKDIHTFQDVGVGCLFPEDCRNLCCLEAEQSVCLILFLRDFRLHLAMETHCCCFLKAGPFRLKFGNPVIILSPLSSTCKGGNNSKTKLVTAELTEYFLFSHEFSSYQKNCLNTKNLAQHKKSQHRNIY